MQKILVILVSVVFAILLAGCGGSESNDDSSANITCVHGSHKCIGNALYYCGYSGNDLIWQFSKECDNGCDSSTMQCKSPSQDNDSNSDHASEEQPGHDENREPETRTTECSNLPENAEWNTVSSITQRKEGASWIPSSEGEYNTDPSTEECRFKCKNGYVWNGTECFDPCDPNPCEMENSTGICMATENGYKCNCAGGFFWNGEKCTDPCEPNPCNDPEKNSTGICNVSESGDYICECKENYTWNALTMKCGADSRDGDCSTKPANSVWNDNGANGKFTQTWNGSTWDPENYASSYSSTAGVCRFACSDNYHWENSKCVYKMKTAECTGLPANAQWNTATSITQEWDGSEWQPSIIGVYSETASTNECKYKCADNYHRNSNQCVPNTKTVSCTGLPANAQWNTASSITQTWNGSVWTPTNVGSFSSTASTSECKYKCKTNYTYQSSNSTCKADSKVSNCTGLPANAQWNTASTISQTWNGTSWQPSTAGTYNTTASTSECRYKCDNSHYWYNSECTNPCDYEPCDDIANSTKVCAATSWNNYSCGCNRYYSWTGSACASIPTCSSTSTTPCRLSTTIWSSQSSYAMNWDSAVSYCDNLTEGGNSDWVLPNISQLRTLVQNCSGTVTGGACGVTSSCTSTSCYSNNCYCRPDSTGANSKFGSTNALWSSTPISDKSGYVWGLQYARASTFQAEKSNSNYVRCVR